MSSDAQGRSGRQRWRAPVMGAVAGLVVAAAIIGPAALADSGGNGGTPAKAKPAAAPAPNGVPGQFLNAVAQLVQAGTIDAAQGRALEAQIETGSMDPGRMVARGVVTASQMAAVNDRLVAVKKGLATQAHPDAAGSKAAAAAALSCAAAKSVRGKAAG